MRFAPVLSTAAAVAAVALCATVVMGMARGQTSSGAGPDDAPIVTAALSIPALPPGAAIGIRDASSSPTPGGRSTVTTVTTVTPSQTRSAPTPSSRPLGPPSAASSSRPPAGSVRGQALPLTLATGSATQVITVVAGSRGSTTAVLQAWNRVPGGGWLRWGPALTAHIGSAGLTTEPSESLSATPIGSFALTRSFGHDANPGTSLPYHQTTPADWWISQYGGQYASIYNTMQTCSSACPFDTSATNNPNEHLYYETPFYDYAVVIDYNVSPVVQGAGSAFFLHVTNTAATAGCVAIPQANLVTIMRWLNPAAHPRILIGVG